MRVVSYTRSTASLVGEEIPGDIITKQNAAIREYAKAHDLKIAKTYSDRKYDADENTAFEELLQDGINRQFDAVIIHSIFRCGRDLWSAKEVLLQTFHAAGIGFIVVEDDFSSIGKTNAEAEAYFESKYSFHKQETIRRKVNHRNKSGILSWNDVKYGYRLTENYQLVVDEETAPVVQRIFEMCADGIPAREVANILRQEKVPTPLVSRGTNVKIEDPFKWDRLNVTRLLKNTVYIGFWSKMVQGEEISFENEALVTEDLFYRAQLNALRQDDRAKKQPSKHLYAGLLVDPIHGFVIRLRKRKMDGSEYLAYSTAEIAALYERKMLPMDELNEIVLDVFQKEQIKAKRALEYVKTKEAIQYRDKILDEPRKDAVNLANRLADCEKIRMKVYQDYQIGKVTKEEMDAADTERALRFTEIEACFKKNQLERKNIQTGISSKNPWILMFADAAELCAIDKAFLKKHVERIEIIGLSDITVHFKENSWYEILPEEWRELNG